MTKKFKKILALDFDGVIHAYTSGWKGPRIIPDPPVDGALTWIENFIKNYCTVPDSYCAMAPDGDWEVCIFSSRSRYMGARWAMRNWMLKHGFDPNLIAAVKFPTRKPPAIITIDDRALCFTGTFPNPEDLVNFTPWNKGGPGAGENE